MQDRVHVRSGIPIDFYDETDSDNVGHLKKNQEGDFGLHTAALGEYLASRGGFAYRALVQAIRELREEA